MKTIPSRLFWLAAGLLPVAPTFHGAFAQNPKPVPFWKATLSRIDGSTETIDLEGVGCSRSICSRTQIKGRGANYASLESIDFDRIAAIRVTRPDQAVFELKDGTEQRLSLVNDFRVLYLRTGSSSRKIDLSKVKSMQFAATP